MAGQQTVNLSSYPEEGAGAEEEEGEAFCEQPWGGSEVWVVG